MPRLRTRNILGRDVPTIPIIGSILDRYNPPYAGGEREVGEIRGEEYLAASGIKIDKDKAAQLGTYIRRIRKNIYTEQVADDKAFSAWAYRKPGDPFVGMNTSEWRKNRSERFSKFDSIKSEFVKIFGDDTTYAMTDEQRDNYYSSIYQISSQSGVKDSRLTPELLLAGYYNIRYPEGRDPEFELVNKFYRDREAYIQGIINTFGEDSSEYKNFENSRISNMTSVEIAYDNARKVMGPYFDIGNNPDSFMPDASPEQKELWTDYQKSIFEGNSQVIQGMEQLNAIRMFKRMRDSARSRYVLSTIDANGNSNLDDLLAFWYGDGYYKGKAVTPTGRSYLLYMHGAVTPTPSGSSSLQGQYGNQYGTYVPVR